MKLNNSGAGVLAALVVALVVTSTHGFPTNVSTRSSAIVRPMPMPLVSAGTGTGAARYGYGTSDSSLRMLEMNNSANRNRFGNLVRLSVLYTYMYCSSL